MSDTRSRLTGRVEQSRLEFDQSFAQDTRGYLRSRENVLAIGLGSERCAVRLSDVAGVFADRGITRVPGHIPALLGIAGFRGVVVPVYDLPALLGHAPVVSPRWLMLAAAAQVALAFIDFDGLLQVESNSIVQRDAGAVPHDFINEVLRTPDLLRPIIHLPSVLNAITRQVRETALNEEH
jgi:chemotaxis signal transduction protein